MIPELILVDLAELPNVDRLVSSIVHLPLLYSHELEELIRTGRQHVQLLHHLVDCRLFVVHCIRWCQLFRVILMHGLGSVLLRGENLADHDLTAQVSYLRVVWQRTVRLYCAVAHPAICRSQVAIPRLHRPRNHVFNELEADKEFRVAVSQELRGLVHKLVLSIFTLCNEKQANVPA